jgi:hypothetical protein
MELFYPKIVSTLCIRVNWISHLVGIMEIIIHSLLILARFWVLALAP